MLIMMMNLVSRRVNMKDILHWMLSMDELAVVAESKWEMQEVLGSGRRHFGSIG